jgi:hypothetical protein
MSENENTGFRRAFMSPIVVEDVRSQTETARGFLRGMKVRKRFVPIETTESNFLHWIEWFERANVGIGVVSEISDVIQRLRNLRYDSEGQKAPNGGGERPTSLQSEWMERSYDKVKEAMK